MPQFMDILFSSQYIEYLNGKCSVSALIYSRLIALTFVPLADITLQYLH